MSEVKPRKDCEMALLDPAALWELGRVAHFGTKKYPKNSYLKDADHDLYYSAAQRHLMAYWAGYDHDAESGLSHLAHAAWNILALLTFRIRKIGNDNRPFKKGVQQ